MRRIRVRRLDAAVPLPKYHSSGAAAFDLSARTAMVVPPGQVALIPTGLIIEVPADHALVIAARSSLPIRKRLMVANGIGVVDADFCGPQDEIHVEVYNFSPEPVGVEAGERIAQGLIVPVVRAVWQDVQATRAPSRGGFGSTGGYEP
jgi:dUTP pyrophosphatase